MPNLIYGSNGNDNLVGTAGTDYIFGYAGNDLVEGGAGGDSLSRRDWHRRSRLCRLQRRRHDPPLERHCLRRPCPGRCLSGFENVIGSAFATMPSPFSNLLPAIAARGWLCMNRTSSTIGSWIDARVGVEQVEVVRNPACLVRESEAEIVAVGKSAVRGGLDQVTRRTRRARVPAPPRRPESFSTTTTLMSSSGRARSGTSERRHVSVSCAER